MLYYNSYYHEKNDNDVKDLFGLFIAIVSRLMGPEGNEPNKIQRYIKLFLTKVHLVDKKLLEYVANIPVGPKSKKKDETSQRSTAM